MTKNITLDDKINESISLIQKGEHLALSLNPKDGYFVGFSGGKDSQVLLELVRMSGVKFHAYYSVTTNDPPENVYFIRNHYPEVTFLHPKRNFFKLVEHKGLPTIFHRFCCEYLKEKAGAGNVVLTGVRAEESRKRALYDTVMVKSKRKEHKNREGYSLEQMEQNQHRCIKGKDAVMVYPLLQWKEFEVWQFIYEHHLPVNPCYNLFGRVGCMFCPFSGRRELMYYEERYPRFKNLFLASLQKYLDRRNADDVLGRDAKDFYDWWKTKTTLDKYLAKKQQLELNFGE
jgi:phosphoadenosine phosphosulfate reductase